VRQITVSEARWPLLVALHYQSANLLEVSRLCGHGGRAFIRPKSWRLGLVLDSCTECGPLRRCYGSTWSRP
jgi:hypothetical protein